MKQKLLILTFYLFCGIQLFSQFYDRPLNRIAFEDYLPSNVSFPFSFVVIGDTRDETSNIDEDFMQLMTQIPDLHPAFVIDVGDVVISGTEQQYQDYYQFIKNWMTTHHIAFFTVPGNHEFYHDNSYSQYFPYYIGDKNFSFDVGNVRIIAINNVQHGDNDNAFSILEEQLNFVEEKLSEPNSPPVKFTFTHVPITQHLNFINYPEFYNLLVNYAVKANFCGHWHRYQRYYFCDNLFEIITGGGGAPSDEDVSINPPNEHPVHHFLLVSVDESGSAEVKTHFIYEGNNETAQMFDFVIPPRQDLILQNYFIPTGSERLFAAQNSINVAGNGTDFIIENNANVEMVAGKRITLKPGFQAKYGCNFKAYIQDIECENISSNKSKFTLTKAMLKPNKIVTNKEPAICIFPNPAPNGVFTLYFYGSLPEISSIVVHNIEGTAIYKKEFDKKYTKHFTVDISNQSKGVYFVKIKTKNKVFTRKIIIH